MPPLQRNKKLRMQLQRRPRRQQRQPPLRRLISWFYSSGLMFTHGGTCNERQSGGFHGGAGMDSLNDEAAASDSAAPVTGRKLIVRVPMVGAVEQPVQACPDGVRTQQGAASEQHAVSGAATAPSVIQASSAMATKRNKVRRTDCINLSLARSHAIAPDSRDCDPGIRGFDRIRAAKF